MSPSQPLQLPVSPVHRHVRTTGRQHRFDNHATTVAIRNGQVVRLISSSRPSASTAATTALRAENAPVSGTLPGFRWNKRQIRTFGIEHLGAFTDIAVKGQDVIIGRA